MSLTYYKRFLTEFEIRTKNRPGLDVPPILRFDAYRSYLISNLHDTTCNHEQYSSELIWIWYIWFQ